MRRLLVSFVALLLCAPSFARAQAFASVCSATSPRIGVDGWTLTVDGRPRFLVLASYFAAMQADDAQIERDFAFLKSKGIDGVRVLPFWTFNDPRPSAASTLVDPRGRIRNGERWDHFTTILKIAGQCGFVVDVTFNREQLWAVAPPFTLDEYRGNARETVCVTPGAKGSTGIAEITCRLKTPDYRHVFMDLQNERDHGEGPTFPPPGSMRLTDAQVRAIRDTVKGIDPARLVMASHIANQIVASVDLASPAKGALDVIAFHQGQDREWYVKTKEVVQDIKRRATASGFMAPVYLQENGAAPDRGASCDQQPGVPNPFIEAVTAAKRAGAAAWTFHNHEAFALAARDFRRGTAPNTGRASATARGSPPAGVGPGLDNCATEREFLDRFKRAIGD